jgi:hypothetical protein
VTGRVRFSFWVSLWSLGATLCLCVCCQATPCAAFEQKAAAVDSSVTTIEVVESECDPRSPGTRRDTLVHEALQESKLFSEEDEMIAGARVRLVRRIADYWGGVPRKDPDSKGPMLNVLRSFRTSARRALKIHWSAAFTSWLMCRAGFSMDEFKRGVGHRLYIDHALTTGTAAHRVLDAAVTMPRPGDLVCADASPSPRVRSLADYRAQRPTFIHCHLVVSADLSRVSVVGGNVTGKVRTTEIRPVRTGTGFGLPWSSEPGNGWAWFAVLSLMPGRE